MSKVTSWADRFALIDHFKPSESQICAAFGLTPAEYQTAAGMRAAGTFAANAGLDVAKYADVFNASGPTAVSTSTAVVKPQKGASSSVHAKPESASKRVKVPQKRGRKGDKIATALAAVPTTQVSVDTFMQQHGVSLAVLRQSKRFIAKLDPAVAATIGKINVRQDKTTKQLMIWRETN